MAENFINSLLGSNFQARPVSLPNPNMAMAVGMRGLNNGFEQLVGMGNDIKQRRIDSDVGTAVSSVDGTGMAPEQYQKALFGAIGQVDGMTATKALGLASGLAKPAMDARAYQNDRFDANRDYNLDAYKANETARHNRQGEVEYFEGPEGGQYAYDPNYIAKVESGGSYTAKNPNSSAYGKYQHINATRQRVAKQLGITDTQAKTPQGQEAVQRALETEYKQQIAGLGKTVNNESMLAIHQMGYPMYKRAVEGKLTTADKTLMAKSVPIQSSNYAGGVKQLIPGTSTEDEDKSLGTVGERDRAEKQSQRNAVRNIVDVGLTGKGEVNGYDELIANPTKFGLTQEDVPKLIVERRKLIGSTMMQESDLYSDLGGTGEGKDNRQAQEMVGQTESLIRLNSDIQKDVDNGLFKTGPIDTAMQNLATNLPLNSFMGYSQEELGSYLRNKTKLSNTMVQYVKEISGAAVTDSERKLLYDIMTGGDYANERQMAIKLSEWSRQVLDRRRSTVNPNLHPMSSYQLGNARIPDSSMNNNNQGSQYGADTEIISF